MKKILTTLALSLALSLGVASPGAADPKDPAPAHEPAPLVIGDEVTRLAKGEILAERPGWDVDAVRLRPVWLMLPILREHREENGETADEVVLALGSHPTGATRARYLWALDLIDTKATVVLVAPKVDRDEVSRKRVQGTRKVRQIQRRVSEYDNDVCVAPWNRVVRRHPESLSANGVTPTQEGQERLAALIDRVMKRCEAGPRWLR